MESPFPILLEHDADAAAPGANAAGVRTAAAAEDTPRLVIREYGGKV